MSRAMSERIRSLQMNDGNRRWWALGAMCFALFMIMLDNTVVNVALPSIQRGLHASTSSLEWTVNAYTLSFAVLLVTGGRLGDLFGRRRMFLVGVTILVLGQIVFATVRTPLIRLLIGLIYAVPATVAGYQLCFALAGIGVPAGDWQHVFAAAGAVAVGLTAFARMGLFIPPSAGQGPAEGTAHSDVDLRSHDLRG